MLGAMLGAHSDCIATPETQFIEHQFAETGFNPGALNARETLARILANRRYRLLWQVPIDLGSVSAERIGSTYSGVLSWLVQAYSRKHGKAGGVWIDHTPTNFRRALTLLRLFPEARFIHLVRDGRAVAASLLPLDWGPNNALHAAEYWMARCAAGLAAESQLGPERVLRVRFEDLVSNPGFVLQRIATFAGLDYQPAMAEGAGLQPGRYHQQQHHLVGQPPDPSRLDRWRQSLAPRQVEIFEAEAGDVLSLLGYEQLYGIRARPATQIEVLRMRVADLARRAGNNLRRYGRARRSLGERRFGLRHGDEGTVMRRAGGSSR
jgi:Sulfotransferase family